MIITIAYRREHAGEQEYAKLGSAEQAAKLLRDLEEDRECECCRPAAWVGNERARIEDIIAQAGR